MAPFFDDSVYIYVTHKTDIGLLTEHFITTSKKKSSSTRLRSTQMVLDLPSATAGTSMVIV